MKCILTKINTLFPPKTPPFQVTLVKFNPTVGNVLASCSGDHTVKIWDIEKGEAVTTFEGNTELTQDLAWDYQGNILATSCKDKNIRMIDGRTGALANTITTPHEGSKSVKTVWLGNSGKFATVGFTRQSQRELKIWDMNNLDKEVSERTNERTNERKWLQPPSPLLN